MTAIYALWHHNGDEADKPAKSFGQVARRYGRSPLQAWSTGSLTLGKCLYPLLPQDHLQDGIENTQQRWIVSADVRLSERDDLATQLRLDPALVSDSMLVSQALERWGHDAFTYIYGAFAIAAWDTQSQTLLLACDPLGTRPLYYYSDGQRTYAASMPDVLFSTPTLTREPDVEQYQQFLRMQAFAPGKTAYKDVHVVRPGHVVTVSALGIRDERWWQPDLSPLQLPSQTDYEKRLSHVLDNAVKSCLRRAHGKIGTHLSAGFDSTAVATTAAKILHAQGEHITAFVAAPREGPKRTMPDSFICDESKIAAQTAAMHDNMDLVRVVAQSGPLSELWRTRAIYPTPINNLCNLPWLEEINDAARDRGITVLLHGAWGNTTLSETGVWALREMLSQGRFKQWAQIARGLVRGKWMRWRGVVFHSIENWLPDPLWVWIKTRLGHPPDNDRAMSLLSDIAYERAGKAYNTIARQLGEPEVDTGQNIRERASSATFRFASIRTNGDGEIYKTMLAEWGLDLRDPTADRRLLELALRIPVERLIWKGEPRAILRRVLADRVPAQVLDNRKRGYQGADWAQGIRQNRSAFINELERLEMYEPTAAFLDTDKIRQLITDLPDEHSEEWDTDEAENSYRLACLNTISVASHMRHVARSNL